MERAGIASADLVPALRFTGAYNFFLNMNGSSLDIYFETSFVYQSLNICLSK